MGRYLQNILIKGSGLSTRSAGAFRPGLSTSGLLSEYTEPAPDLLDSTMTSEADRQEPGVAAVQPRPGAMPRLPETGASKAASLIERFESAIPQPLVVEPHAIAGGSIPQAKSKQNQSVRQVQVENTPAAAALSPRPFRLQPAPLRAGASEGNLETPASPRPPTQTIARTRVNQRLRDLHVLDGLAESRPEPQDSSQAPTAPTLRDLSDSRTEDQEQGGAAKNTALTITPSPVGQAPGPPNTTQDLAPEPQVHVRIGRVEVRMQQPQPFRAAERKPRSTGFAAYARVRSYLE
jgi:hypothetical protein